MKACQVKVFSLLSDILDVDQSKLNGSTNLRDELDVDSTEMVDIVVSVEKAFSINIDGDAPSTFITVDDICNYVANSVTAA